MAEIELSGDSLPLTENPEHEKRWYNFLGEKSETWRVYTTLREMILEDGIVSIEEKDLLRVLRISRNRFFTVILPKLSNYGLLEFSEIDG